jgi:chromosome condensin MukBEF MukE localization factor
MDQIKVNLDLENQTISVYNNGRGIPIEMHAVEGVYVPELIFGHLLTSSNYDDDEAKVICFYKIRSLVVAMDTEQSYVTSSVKNLLSRQHVRNLGKNSSRFTLTICQRKAFLA